MEYIRIPHTELNVSRIALGTWAIGGWMWGGNEDQTSLATIRRAIDKGITLIDTAPVYGFGHSEEIVGKAIQGYVDRDKVFISTKTALEWDNGKVRRNASPERIFKEIDDSLRRLQTDYIDIYFVHWPDPVETIEKTAEAMRQLLENGKIRAVGVSNFSCEQMDAFRQEAPLHVSQPPYNMYERAIEHDMKSYCHENGIALMTYGAICRGLLSGKMSVDRTFEGDDLRKHDPKFKAPRFEQYLKASEALKQLANRRFGKDLLPTAVRWVLDQGIEIALWGARRPEQLAPLHDICNWRIDDDGKAEIDQILDEIIKTPVGPEFMAPPDRNGNRS
jgi:aryl-alcohol dehydrogenase-like predicted oxidoreductase